MYERNNGQGINRGGFDYPYENARNEKTSVKVHNPPGGRTNFTLGWDSSSEADNFSVVTNKFW